jgi:ketosteroid isomerase-like protein
MDEVDKFLDSTLPRLREADVALQDGDAHLRIAMWSPNDPVTLFGAAGSATGWKGIKPVFEALASRFSQCESWEYDVIGADVSGDLAYLVGTEHITGSIAGAPPVPFSLRVTTIFRREDGEWKVVHRHADPLPESDSARELAHRMKGALATNDNADAEDGY